jgi:YopX protein
MLNFNWNELNLTNRMYICLLAGLHESYAFLRYEDFNSLSTLRESDVPHRLASAGEHWTAAIGEYWVPDTFSNGRGDRLTGRRWGDDAVFRSREKAKHARPVKFRQLIGGRWHNWGLIDEEFTPPVSNVLPSQQFTGLFSKSHQEIYEGDIGKLVLDGIIPLYVVCLMEWSAESASFRWATKQVINIKDTGKEWKVEESRRFEIIGNIFQNPELIVR